MIEILANDFAGILGAFLVLLAFWLLTHKVIHSHSYIYLGLNFAGGLALALETWTRGANASFTLNIIWAGIAIYGFGWAHKRKAPKVKR